MFWNEYCGSGFMGGMFAGHWFVMIIALALLFFVSWLFFTHKGQGAGKRNDDVAFELLRQRYAAGEIDEAEYVRRRGNLS